MDIFIEELKELPSECNENTGKKGHKTELHFTFFLIFNIKFLVFFILFVNNVI